MEPMRKQGPRVIEKGRERKRHWEREREKSGTIEFRDESETVALFVALTMGWFNYFAFVWSISHRASHLKKYKKFIVLLIDTV